MADRSDRDILDDIQNIEILNYLERRQRLVCTDRGSDLDNLDDTDFQSRYRLNKHTVEVLLHKLNDRISSGTTKNNALSPVQKMCIALRYFASGSFQLLVGDLAKVSQSSASRAIKQVSQALAELRPEYIQLPQTEYERQQVSREFHQISGFPGVFGALDCTLIPIISPGGDLAETFHSRKSWFALNVQTVSDASLYIRDIVACWPGSTHDSTIFDNSHLRAIMETQIPPHYHLLGDNGYGCRSYLLTPFLNPTINQQRRYNTAHVKARNVVERQYGIWKNRFACLDNTLTCKLETSMTVIVATAVLHNIALEMRDTAVELIDVDTISYSIPGSSHASDSSPGNHVSGIAKRNSLLSTVFS